MSARTPNEPTMGTCAVADWAGDPKLYEYFVRESHYESHNRISYAAAREFW
jgi:hypothetical protein